MKLTWAADEGQAAPGKSADVALKVGLDKPGSGLPTGAPDVPTGSGQNGGDSSCLGEPAYRPSIGERLGVRGPGSPSSRWWPNWLLGFLDWSPSRSATAATTLAVWVAAGVSWASLWLRNKAETKLGWDLLTSWRAETAFAHGGQPYKVKAFVYPPSSLIVMRPIALLDREQLIVGGLVAVAAITWLSVMIAAEAIGFRWWGPVAAVTVLLLSGAGGMEGEMPLENVSILMFLAMSLFFLFVLRSRGGQGRWLWAGAVIGLSVCIKPLLFPVLVIFVISKRWKALGLAWGIPVVLNGWGLAVVRDPHEVLSKLPSLLNRTGSGVAYNSAWVDVARSLGIPEGFTILLRIVSVVLVVLATWLVWKHLCDARARIITASSVLLIGAFLAGTLSEYHFMLTLVPFAMTIVIAGSPMRTIPAVIGMVWVMDDAALPIFGLSRNGADSLFRAIGMGMIVVTVIAVVMLRLRHRIAVGNTTSVGSTLDPGEGRQLTGALQAASSAD